jgi:hypothetical protein
MGFIESAAAADVPIGRAVLLDTVMRADPGHRVLIGTGAQAALIVDETRVAVNTTIAAETFKVGGTARVTGDTAIDSDLLVSGDTTLVGNTLVNGTVTVDDDVTLHQTLTVDLDARFNDCTVNPTSRSISTHSKYGMRVGNARVVNAGDVLGSILIADRVYERAETDPFLVKVSTVNEAAATITLTQAADPAWAPPENSTFMLEPPVPDGTYAIIAIGTVSGQTANAFVYKSQNQLTPVSLGNYTYTQLVATTTVDTANTNLQVDPNAPLAYPVPGYVMSTINPTLTFGGSQVFPGSANQDRYYYDIDSDQAFKLLGTNTLQAVDGVCLPLKMRSESIAFAANRVDVNNTDGTIQLRLTGTDALATLLTSASNTLSGVSTFEEYDGLVVRLEVGGKSFALQSHPVISVPPGGATYTQFVVSLADAANALAPELQNSIGYVLVTTVGSSPGRGLAEQTVSFTCELEVNVMEEFVDTFLTFLGTPPSAGVEAAFFSAAITNLVIDGITYDVVGKDIVVQSQTYRVRLLASEFDASNLDLGNVNITLRYQDTDIARAISFIFKCYTVDAIIAPTTVNIADAPTIVDFSGNSARMDLTGLFDPDPFNTIPFNAYFRQFQVRESVLHLKSTTRDLSAGPGNLVVNVVYEAGETNILYNGLNTVNALTAGIPVRLRGLSVNGGSTACQVEPVLSGDDPVPDGSSHVYIYTTQLLGYYLMRIASRYRNNVGTTIFDLVPVRQATPPWDDLTPVGEDTIFYVIPFAIKQLFQVGQGGPYSILSKPIVNRPAWVKEEDVEPPERTSKLYILSEAPSYTPWKGAPATLLYGTASPTFVQETLRTLPDLNYALFPRASYYAHDAEPPDLHFYSFFADLSPKASGVGTVISSDRLAPTWCTPGGYLQLYYPDDSLPLAISRSDTTTDNGVMDIVAGSFTSPVTSGGVFYRNQSLQYGKVTAADFDTWVTNVKVNTDHTVVTPFAATDIFIGGAVYEPVSGVSTVANNVPTGASVALGLGDLYDVYDVVLQLAATITITVSPPYETVTVPAAHLEGGSGTRYKSLTVTGSDGYTRHLDIPANGQVRYAVATAPAVPPVTLSANMHLDSRARVTGIGVIVPPATSQISGSLTQYFKYAGSTTDRTLLTPGVAYTSPTARTILTLSETNVRRITSCIGTVVGGVATLPSGTGAQMSEGVEVFMLEGGLLTNATLVNDTITFTATAETTALLAACPVPGSALITLIGKARMKVKAFRLSSIAALTFPAAAGSVSVSASAASTYVKSIVLMDVDPPAPLFNGTAPIAVYDQVDALPWQTSLTSPLTAGTTNRTAAGNVTLLLNLNYRGRSWSETSVTVASGTATLDVECATPSASCVVVTAVSGTVYASTLAAGVRSFACAASNASRAPAVIIHSRDQIDVTSYDISTGDIVLNTTPVTAARLDARSAAMYLEAAGETDVMVILSSILGDETVLTGTGTPNREVTLIVDLENSGSRPLTGTSVNPLIVACPFAAKSELSKIVELQLMDNLRIGDALELGATLTVGGDVELDGPMYFRNRTGDAVTIETDVHGMATVRRRNQTTLESIAFAKDGAVALRRGIQPRTVQVLTDQRFGTLITLDGSFVDSALQYLRRATFARDTNKNEVRLLPQAPLTDGHTGSYSVNATQGGNVVCGTPTPATFVSNTIAYDWHEFDVLPVTDDWVVISLDNDAIRRRVRVRSAITFTSTRTLTVNFDFGTTPQTGVIELTELEGTWTYDGIQLAAQTAAAVYELSRAFRIVDSSKTRFHDLEFQGNGVRPVGSGTNEITLYISDTTAVTAAQTSALSTVLDADKRLRVGRTLIKSWTNFEVGSAAAQFTTSLQGDVTIGTAKSTGSTSGYHAATRMYGSLTLGEDTVTGQEPTQLYGALTVGATEVAGVTSGHHAATRLYGSLTLGENTTTGQEASQLYGALTVGATEVSGVTAGHHAATRLYGSLTLGENTTTGQEASQLYGALTVGATEVSGVTAGHHAATRLYGPLTLGEATTTGQEPTVLNGSLTVGQSVGTGAIAGKHADTALYGKLVVGEATTSAQETTNLNGAVTIGAAEVSGVTAGKHAATRVYGSLTLGENTTTGQEASQLYGALTVGATEVSGVTAGHHAPTRLYGALTLGEDTATGQEATRLYGALTVGATEVSGVTAGHHAATRLYGPLTLGEATTTGQEPTILNGAFTVGQSVGTGSIAGKHADTALYGKLVVGEATVSAQETTILNGAVTIGAGEVGGVTAGKHAATRVYGSLTLGEDTTTGQEATRLYGSFTVGATEVSGVTAGHHAATRLYGPLTLGEATTTGQEPTILNGAFTVGQAVGTGSIAGKHADTALYGKLVVGEATVSAQETTILNGAVTIGAGEVGGVTAGKHAATRVYGSLTLGEDTTTGQEATRLYGALTVGATEVSGVTAGHHAVTRLFGPLTLGEDTATGQEATRLYGAFTVGATEVSGVTTGHHAATRLYGPLTLGEATTTGQEPTVLNGAFTVGQSVGTGAIAGKHADTALYGKLVVGEATTTAQETTNLNGAVTIGAGESGGVTAGKHAATRIYGSLTLGEDTTTGQEPTRLYGAFTVGATEVSGVTAGHHAATRLYGPLTLGEATTTGQEPTVLNGAFTVGQSVGTGAIAGKHADTALYGKLVVGEATTTAQETSTLNGAVTIGAAESGGVTAGKHAATRIYGSLTLGESTTTGQEPTVLNGTLTVGESVGSGSTAGKHANTVLYGRLTVGEASGTAQETTTLNGAVTIGTQAFTATTQMNGDLTVGVNGETTKKVTTLNGPLFVTLGQASNLQGTFTVGTLAGNNVQTTFNGPVTVELDQATLLRGTLTVLTNKDTTLGGNLTVGVTGNQKTTSLQGALTVGTTGFLANTILHGSLTVADTQSTSLTGPLTVSSAQATNLGGTLTVQNGSSTSLTGPLTVSSAQATNLGGTLTVQNGSSTSLTGPLTVSSNQASLLLGTLEVGASGNLKSTTLHGPLTVSDSQATSLSGTLGVTNATSLGNTLNVSGATTLSNTLNVSGATTLSNTLNVSGTSTLGTLNAGRITSLTSNPGYTNNATLAGGAGADIKAPFIVCDYLDVGVHISGVSPTKFFNPTTAPAITSTGSLSVSGGTTLSSTLTVSGTSSLNGATTVANTLTVSGSNATSLGGSLTVSGASNLNSTLTVSSTTNIGGALNVNNSSATTLSGSLSVTGSTTLTGAVSVQGTDVVSRIATAKSEAISTASADATSKANTAQDNAISTAAADATSKANTAQSNAISTAASDATTKANNALTSANSYTDAHAYVLPSGVVLSTNSITCNDHTGIVFFAGSTADGYTAMFGQGGKLFFYSTKAGARPSTIFDDGRWTIRGSTAPQPAVSPFYGGADINTGYIAATYIDCAQHISIGIGSAKLLESIPLGTSLTTGGKSFQFRDDGHFWITGDVHAENVYVFGNQWKITSSASDLDFSYNGSLKAYIQDTRPVGPINFTGMHRCYLNKEYVPEDLSGLVVVAKSDEYYLMDGGLARGVSAITVSESLPVVTISDGAMDKRVFGVIAEEESDERIDAIGGLVAPFEKPVGDTRVHVNSVGEGAVWVTDECGNIESGDYLTTGVVRGYACRQSGDALMSYTVAKTTMSCNFSNIVRPKMRVSTTSRTVWKDKIRTTQKEIKKVVFENGRYVQKIVVEDSTDLVKEVYDLYDEEGNVIAKHEATVQEEVEELVNDVDQNGDAVWVEETDANGAVVMEPIYRMRWLLPDGTQITEAEYTEIKSGGGQAFRAAFLGCTYKAG